MTMFSDLLARDLERSGLTPAQAARQFRVPETEYRRLEEGEAWPAWETYDRIERLFGWPRSFASTTWSGSHKP